MMLRTTHCLFTKEVSIKYPKEKKSVKEGGAAQDVVA